ncbi:MAG: response regulator [Verrucomicrobiota bacterium]
MAGFPHIAVVDDEEAIVEILSYSLKKRFPDAKITGFGRPDQAWDWLGYNKVDLLLTDLNMPQMDGRELVSMMNQCAPKTPVFVISGALMLSDLKELEKEYPMVRVFAKPLLTRELIVEMEKALSKGELPTDSQLRGLDVLNLLQLLHLQAKTCEVFLESTAGKGRLALKSGQLVLIEYNGEHDDDSFNKILTLPNPDIKIEPIQYSGADLTGKSFEVLLSEFCRKRDEGTLPKH